MIPLRDLLVEDSFAVAARTKPGSFDISVNHDGYEFTEAYPRSPTKSLVRLSRIRDEDVDFERPEVAVRGFCMFAPVQAGIGECFLDEFSNGMGLASADNKVIRLVLLHDVPNGFYILGSVTPIAAGIEIAQIQSVCFSREDGGLPP